MADLATELQKIYESEINIRIGWLWDGGIEVRLGDDMNGYLADETVRTVAEIVRASAFNLRPFVRRAPVNVSRERTASLHPSFLISPIPFFTSRRTIG